MERRKEKERMHMHWATETNKRVLDEILLFQMNQNSCYWSRAHAYQVKTARVAIAINAHIICNSNAYRIFFCDSNMHSRQMISKSMHFLCNVKRSFKIKYVEFNDWAKILNESRKIAIRSFCWLSTKNIRMTLQITTKYLLCDHLLQ